MFSYKLAKGTPLLEASWWKKRHGRSRSGLCKWSIKRAWNANKWTMAKCNIYTSFFSMLHTSFEVVVSLKVIFYPNGFLEKKNYAKTRPGSDFSTMSYRKGERNAMWRGTTFFIYESWNNIALTKGGQNSPIYKRWKPCKLSMVFTPDCSHLSFTINKQNAYLTKPSAWLHTSLV